MSFPGPFPISNARPTSIQDLSFHLYDRVTAHVVQVGATQAVLEVNGYPVVAKLTSRDQAAELLSRRSADFVITQLSADQITLKFAGKEAKGEGKPVQVELKDLAQELSRNIGLKGTSDQVHLIRSAILQRIPISSAWVDQTLKVINSSGLETSKGIELAVWLKTAGLPITPSSLQWVNQFQDPQLAEAFSALFAELSSSLAHLDSSMPLADQIRTALTRLGAMIPDLSKDEETIRSCLKDLFQFIGKPYEKVMNEQLANGMEQDSFTLYTLFTLGKELRQSGQTRAADSVDRFLEQARQTQFTNIKPDEILGRGQWGEVNFVVKWPEDDRTHNSNAQIRVSYRQAQSSGNIDPEYTNLILHVDLEPGKEVVADLSLFQKKVNAEIMVSDLGLENIFHQSLPEFTDLLEQLGYTVLHTGTKICSMDEKLPGKIPNSDFPSARSLDIEA